MPHILLVSQAHKYARSMAKIAKMEVQTEIKCSADSYYDIFRCKSHLIPKICPNLVKDIQVLSGDRKQWIYVAGKATNTI